MEMTMNRPDPDAPAPTAGEASLLPGYSRDFALWLRAQTALLRERKFDLLDVDNLADEVDDMGKNLHRELKSRLRVVLIHLLKCRYQPDQRSSHWLATLGEQRNQITDLIEQSPSLERHVAGYANARYPQAVARAAQETGLPPSSFPASNPFSQAQLLDPDYLP
jgi:hypothetical protein